MSIVTVYLPWPSDRLGQNSREHWRIKAEATKQARADAKMLTLEVMAGFLPIVGKVPLMAALRFYPPDRKRYDVFNLADRMKSAIDGIFDALQMDDHLICSGSVQRCGVVKGGQVVIEIRRMSNEPKED